MKTKGEALLRQEVTLARCADCMGLYADICPIHPSSVVVKKKGGPSTKDSFRKAFPHNLRSNPRHTSNEKEKE